MYSIDQILELLTKQNFADWYRDGGLFDSWLTGEKDVTEEELKESLKKLLGPEARVFTADDIRQYLRELEQKEKFQISFLAQGQVVQTLGIVDPEYTPDKIIKLLRSGEAFTTVQEGGDVIIWGENQKMKVIAKVIDSDNQLEYEDFE